MISDYQSWYEQNEDFLKHLFEHDSKIFYRINDVITVMDHIANHMEENEIDEDLEVVFDVGFSYLFNRVKEINLYLENNFDNDLHKLLKYEDILDYVFYVDDLKDALIEKEMLTDLLKKDLDEIQEKAICIIEEKKKFGIEDIEYYDSVIISNIPNNKEVLTVPEVFGRILEELRID